MAEIWEQVADMYRELVDARHTDVRGWPVLEGHNVDVFAFEKTLVLHFKHVGRQSMRGHSALSDLSRVAAGWRFDHEGEPQLCFGQSRKARSRRSA